MALKTKVKAGNITNLSDARYCAGMGVDWLSFPSNLVNPITFKEITDWVSGPQFILELEATTPIQSIKQYPVSIVEISFDQLMLINQMPSIAWIVKIPVSAWSSNKNELLKYKDHISHLVLELDAEDIQILEEITNFFRLLVNPSEKYQIAQLLSLPIEGINVTGEHELKPGLKDFDKLSSILEELEVIDY